MTTTTTRRERRRSSFPWHLLRRWVYGVALAAGALALFYGLLPPEAIPLWLGLLLALLNTRPAPTPDEPAEPGPLRTGL